MKTSAFKKIVRENRDDLQKVLNLHMMNKIYLTTSQVDLVIKKRDKIKLKGKINE